MQCLCSIFVLPPKYLALCCISMQDLCIFSVYWVCFDIVACMCVLNLRIGLPKVYPQRSHTPCCCIQYTIMLVYDNTSIQSMDN
jgi:hypothetical protein